MDELYELYGDKYIQLADDEESSSEVNDDEYILPISTQQLMKYLDEQEESMLFKLYFFVNLHFYFFLGDENLVPVIHTPVIDDSLMTAEDHQQRRRRSIY